MINSHLIFLLFGYLAFLQSWATGQISTLDTHTIRYIEGNYLQDNVVTLDAHTEYILAFPNTSTSNPYRVSVRSAAKLRNPALIVVRQEKQVLSWQLPMLVRISNGYLQFKRSSRTLCFSDEETYRRVMNVSVESTENTFKRNFSVSVSTSSPRPINVTITADEVTNYFIENNKSYRTTISPSEPVFYFYRFPETEEPSRAFIEIHSEDDVCLTVSIQQSLCPVRDLNKDIEYEGDFLTINLKGGLVVRQSRFPEGFFLVFVAKGDNFDCNQESSMLPMPRNRGALKPMNRSSTLRFSIREGITPNEYVTATMVILGANLAFCLFMILVVIAFHFYRKQKKKQEMHIEAEEPDEVDSGATDDVDKYLESDELTVRDFIKKKSRIQKKSFNYLWHITNIGIFYGIPVVQLMVSYQRTVNLTGDLDICYHNFLCAHPLGGFNDFNHIYSNVGYILLGILLLCITCFKHLTTVHYPKCGIPKHYGLFYAMGIALILEGLLSACYHICPNQSNYQFDTSFMYVMAVLCIINLYQNRHPSINASAYATFTVLGVAVFVAMLGIISNSTAIMIIFVLSYVSLCMYLSFKIYFFGYVVKGILNFIEICKGEESYLRAIVPVRKGRFVLLLMANICNLVMAILGIIFYPSYTDFGTYLLAILMGNSVLHAIFYIAMKLYYKERLCWQACVYSTLGIVSWGASTYFFLSGSTLWSVTPAESRQLNKECVFLNFYDNHDIWHLLSAPALFFSFMMLIHLDDDLIKTPQSQIISF